MEAFCVCEPSKWPNASLNGASDSSSGVKWSSTLKHTGFWIVHPARDQRIPGALQEHASHSAPPLSCPTPPLPVSPGFPSLCVRSDRRWSPAAPPPHSPTGPCFNEPCCAFTTPPSPRRRAKPALKPLTREPRAERIVNGDRDRKRTDSPMSAVPSRVSAARRNAGTLAVLSSRNPGSGGS